MSGESKSSTDLRNLIEALPESDNKQRLLKLIPREERLTSILELNGKVHSRENILRMMEEDAPKGALKQRIQESLLEIEDLKKHPVPRLQRFIESIRSCVNGKFYTVNDDLAVFLGEKHAYWVFKELREDLQTRTGTYKQDTSNMLKTILRNLNNLEKALDGGNIDSVKQYLHFMKSNFVHFERRYELLHKQTPSELYENIRDIFSQLIFLTNMMIKEWKKMNQGELNTVIAQAYNIIAEKIPEELVDMIRTEMRPVSLRL